MMTDINEFTSEEFADYWDSIGDDMEAGIDFMAHNVVDVLGRDLLGDTVTVLARRHGVSSDKIKTFRMALRKACKKAGIDDIFTPLKRKGTGTKADPIPTMYIGKSKAQEKPAIRDNRTLAYNRMEKWVLKDGMDANEILDAAQDIFTKYR